MVVMVAIWLETIPILVVIHPEKALSVINVQVQTAVDRASSVLMRHALLSATRAPKSLVKMMPTARTITVPKMQVIAVFLGKVDFERTRFKTAQAALKKKAMT